MRLVDLAEGSALNEDLLLEADAVACIQHLGGHGALALAVEEHIASHDLSRGRDAGEHKCRGAGCEELLEMCGGGV